MFFARVLDECRHPTRLADTTDFWQRMQTVDRDISLSHKQILFKIAFLIVLIVVLSSNANIVGSHMLSPLLSLSLFGLASLVIAIRHSCSCSVA